MYFLIIDLNKIKHTTKYLDSLHQICIRHSIIETKEVACIGYSRFLFPQEYSGEEAPRPSSEYECGKTKLLYPIWATSFVSIVMYLTFTIMML